MPDSSRLTLSGLGQLVGLDKVWEAIKLSRQKTVKILQTFNREEEGEEEEVGYWTGECIF